MPFELYDDDDYDEEERDGPRSSFVTYVAEGDVFFKQGEYKKALESYTLALDQQPDECSCLVARSKCFLEMNEPHKALQDAEDSLKDDREFHKGLYRKAEALYRLGDFEYALMFYHRGQKLRPELDEFRLGIQKSQDAIENAIGKKANIKLENKGDLTFFAKQDDLLHKKKPAFKKHIMNRNQQKHLSRSKEAKAAPLSSKTQKELLGELYADKEYLEKLMGDMSLVNGPANTRVHGLVKDGLEFLDKRSEFWRQQKPIYAREKLKKTSSKGETKTVN